MSCTWRVLASQQAQCQGAALTELAVRNLALSRCLVCPQEKLYAYISVGGRHQNTSLNTSDARSPSWSDTLTFEHPSSEHTEISVAVYAKHTLLPDTLVGSAGRMRPFLRAR